MSINTEINRLLNFAKQRGLINREDLYYSANLLLDVEAEAVRIALLGGQLRDGRAYVPESVQARALHGNDQRRSCLPAGREDRLENGIGQLRSRARIHP